MEIDYCSFFLNITSLVKENPFNLTALCFLILLVLYGLRIWLSYRYFEKQGIKTPQYSFILGNLQKLLQNKNDTSQVNEWTKELGKTYGFV